MEVCYKKFLQRDYITLYKGKFLQRDYITLYKGKVLESTLCIMFLVSCLYFFYTAMLKCFIPICYLQCFVASVINIIYLTHTNSGRIFQYTIQLFVYYGCSLAALYEGCSLAAFPVQLWIAHYIIQERMQGCNLHTKLQGCNHGKQKAIDCLLYYST